MRPSASTAPEMSSSCGGPFGSQPVRPRATIARAPGVRWRAKGSRHPRRRPHGRSCRSSRSPRDRSALPCPPAGRESWQRSSRLPCVPCEAVHIVAESAHIGDGAGRADRGMALHRPVIGSGECLGAVRPLRAGTPLLTRVSSVMPGSARSVAARSSCAGKPDPSLHCARSARAARTARPFIVGDDRKEILDPHHFHAGKVLDRELIDGDELGADRRRPDHAGMLHARHSEVMHVDGVPEHLAGTSGRGSGLPTMV